MTWLITLAPILMTAYGIKHAGGYRAAVHAHRVRHLPRGGYVGFFRPWGTALTGCHADLNEFKIQMSRFARALEQHKEGNK